MDPRGLGHGPESPLGPGRPRRLSEPGPSRQRHRVELAGPGTRARVTRDCFSTPRALGQKRESPGRVGRHRVPSVQGRVPWDSCSTPPHLARSRVSRDACRNRGPLGMGLIRPKGRSTPRTLRLGPKSPSKWVDTAGIRTLARVSRDSWSNPRALGPRTEWPVTAGRPRGPSDPRTSRPGHLVDHACPRTQARVARDSWSTTRALGSWPEAAGRAGGHRGPSDPGPSRLEQLVDPAHPWTQA